MVRAGRVPVRVVGGNPQPLLNVTRSWAPHVNVFLPPELPDEGEPNIPTGLTFTVRSSVLGSDHAFEVLVRWFAATTGGPVAGYEIERAVVAQGAAFELIAAVGLVTSWVDQMVTQGGRYQYRVRAIGTFGNSGWLMSTEIAFIPDRMNVVQVTPNSIDGVDLGTVNALVWIGAPPLPIATQQSIVVLTDSIDGIDIGSINALVWIGASLLPTVPINDMMTIPDSIDGTDVGRINALVHV